MSDAESGRNGVGVREWGANCAAGQLSVASYVEVQESDANCAGQQLRAERDSGSRVEAQECGCYEAQEMDDALALAGCIGTRSRRMWRQRR